MIIFIIPSILKYQTNSIMSPFLRKQPVRNTTPIPLISSLIKILWINLWNVDKLRTWESEEDTGIRTETVMARTVQIFLRNFFYSTYSISTQAIQGNPSIKSFRILKMRFWRTLITLEQDQKQYFNQVKLHYLKTKLQLHFKGLFSEEQSQNKQPKEKAICRLQIMNCHHMQLQLITRGEGEEQCNVPSVLL